MDKAKLLSLIQSCEKIDIEFKLAAYKMPNGIISIHNAY